MTAQEVLLTNQVTLDGSGGGSCYIVIQQASTVLAPRLAIVSTSTATKVPTCVLYRGSAQAPVSVLDNTFTGNGDSTGKVGGSLYYTGQAIWAVWANGDPGAQATLQIYGQTGLQSDLLQAGPVGPSFNASAMSPAQVAAGLINSTLSSVIATAIQSAGVPAIDHPAAVSVIFNQSVAAGADFVSPRLSVGQYQSLVGIFFAQESTGTPGNNPYYRVRFQWSLQSDNYDPLVTEDWVPACGPFSFTTNYRNDYASPCYGDTLTVTVHNYDNQAINVTWGLFGSYRSRIRSFLRGRYPDDLSNEAGGLGSDDILLSANWNATITPGNSLDLGLVQLWEGPTTVSCSVSGGALNQTFIQISPEPSSILGAAFQILNTQNSSFFPISQLILPRRVCRALIHNGSGSGSNITAGQLQIVGQVQPN